MGKLPKLKIFVFAFIFLGLALFSLYKYPFHYSAQLLILSSQDRPMEAPEISVDTSYGFNPLQVIKPLPSSRMVKGEHYAEYPLFTKWSLPQRLQARVSEAPKAIIISNDVLTPLEWKKDRDLIWTTDVSLQPAKRNTKHTLFFLLGLLFSTLPFYMLLSTLGKTFQNRRQKGGKLSLTLEIMISGAFILLFYLYYPGYLNIHNPFGGMGLFEKDIFLGLDSIYLYYFWSFLFEVVPSFFYVCVIQGFLTLSTLLIIRRKIWGASTALLQCGSYCFLVLLIFNLSSQSYFMWVDRNSVSAWIVFFTFLVAWAILVQREKSQIHWSWFCFLIALCCAVRSDSLIFCFGLLTLTVYFSKKKMAWKLLAGSALLVFLTIGPLHRAIEESHADVHELNSAYIFQTCSHGFLNAWVLMDQSQVSSEEREMLKHFWKIDEATAHWKAFEAGAPALNYFNFPTEAVANTYKKDLLRFIIKNRALFFKVRLQEFYLTLLAPVTVFDYLQASEQEQVPVMNYRLAGHSPTQGIRGYAFMEMKDRFYPSNLFFMIFLLVSIFIAPFFAPVGAACSFVFLFRLAIIFLFAPGSLHIYVMDLMLIGTALPLLIYTEMQMRGFVKWRKAIFGRFSLRS